MGAPRWEGEEMEEEEEVRKVRRGDGNTAVTRANEMTQNPRIPYSYKRTTQQASKQAGARMFPFADVLHSAHRPLPAGCFTVSLNVLRKP